MVSKTLQDTKMCTGLSAFCGSNSHLLTMLSVAADRSINRSLVKRNDSFDKGEIAFHDLMPFHLPCESYQCLCVPGNDEQARGIFVQPMDNARTSITTHLLQFGITRH